MLRPLIEDLNKATCTEKYIKSHYKEFYQYILNNYSEDLTWPEKLYWYYHNVSIHPTCPICGNSVKFYNFIYGYQKYCSSKCCNSDPEKKLRIKQTCLEKYGVEHPLQSSLIKNKSKQTCLEKYGVENPMFSKSVKNKLNQTYLKKYGVENPSQSELIKNKKKQTCLERYGVENPHQLKDVKDKAKQTCLERYGVEYSLQSHEIQNKSKQTCLDKYGVENPHQLKSVKDKAKQTCLDKYGVEYFTNRNKSKQTCLERYGVEYPSQSQDIQTKINNTKRLNHTFNSSEIESLFSKYLDSQNIEYIRQYRSKEYPFNCDFYLPKYDLYIEIQASWTHGDHPYNEETDKAVLEIWKSKNTDYYNNAIETWTVRDVNKREIAKQNQLNYLEIFSDNIDETVEIFQQFLVKH